MAESFLNLINLFKELKENAVFKAIHLHNQKAQQIPNDDHKQIYAQIYHFKRAASSKRL